ncbi:MAG: hypothetical protein AAFZ15_03930 [Bacteroidota bacterium]
MIKTTKVSIYIAAINFYIQGKATSGTGKGGKIDGGFLWDGRGMTVEG